MTFADPDSATVVGPTPPPTVMRGPAHADNYRVKVGRYGDRWYRDPLPYDSLAPEALSDEAYPSFSIVKGASGKDWTYVSLKRVAHADDLATIAGKGYYERYEKLKVINKLDLSAAMRRGTNVHIYAECLAYGVPQYLSPASDGAAYFPMVEKMFAELNPKLIAAEFVCIHRSLHGIGYGGTSDGIYEIDGKRYMVDWKSRSEDADHDCYPEEAGQIGAYVGCEYIIMEDTEPANPHGAKRAHMPALDGGLIVSIKPDSYEVYPIALDEAIEHFHAMHSWWTARRDESKPIGPKWAPRQNVSMEDQLQESLDYVERRNGLYARFYALTKKQQEEFTERLSAVDPHDLDNVERVLDDIEHPPNLLDMAKARMARDAEREADRRLSAEGGTADPDDVALFQARWDLGGITDQGKRWIARIVEEAIHDGHDFRLSVFNTQRRANIYNALTEWAAERFDVTDDTAFRAVLRAVSTDTIDERLGFAVGSLTTEEAAALRNLVTEIAAGRWTYVKPLDADSRWEPSTTSAS